MARYLLIQVDDNDKALTLMERLSQAKSVKVLGLFAKPTKFCECKTDSAIGPNARSVLGTTYGMRVHETCRRPKSDWQSPKNLLDPEMSVRFRDIYLKILEPYTPPVEKYGQDVIDRQNEVIARASVKISRSSSEEVQEKRTARRLAARERRRARKQEHPRA